MERRGVEERPEMADRRYEAKDMRQETYCKTGDGGIYYCLIKRGKQLTVGNALYDQRTKISVHD